ncbi:hypothetical protein CVT25_004048 [Psilocybe cyanescens]|uniref:Uncharacterized protein n=1 Tax=Psilocybe cyanescens TaxID=93625 RepID=A0A409WXP3_PSICY|nr:hypothetical protein CVT25_004048 [Psilocybe cyanescens]
MLVMHVTDVLPWHTDTDSPAKPVLPGAVRRRTRHRSLASARDRPRRHFDKGCEVDGDGVVLLPAPAMCVVVRGVVTLYALPLEQGLNDAATDPPTALEYCDVPMAEDKITALRGGVF